MEDSGSVSLPYTPYRPGRSSPLTTSSRGLERQPRSATAAVLTAEGTWGHPSRVTGGYEVTPAFPHLWDLGGAGKQNRKWPMLIQW